MSGKLPELWRPGQPISSDRLNGSVEVARRVSHISGNQVASFPHGTHIASSDPDRYRTIRKGLLVNAGPSGEADYTDERYWIKGAFISSADSDAITVFLSDQTYKQNEPWPLSVTNLAERIPHSHRLFPLNETRPVIYWMEFDDGGAPRWMMNEPPAEELRACLLTESGGGADGTATTSATWEYDATDPVTSAGMGHYSYLANRPHGKTIKATRGIILHNSVDAYLWWCDEVPATKAC